MLFPGGVGDQYDKERGEIENHAKWAQHLLRYFDGRFERHKIWSLYTLNWMTRKDSSKMGGYFLKKIVVPIHQQLMN